MIYLEASHSYTQIFKRHPNSFCCSSTGLRTMLSTSLHHTELRGEDWEEEGVGIFRLLCLLDEEGMVVAAMILMVSF